MTSILIVDDSSVDAHLAGRLLQKHLDVKVSYAADGEQAKTMIDAEPPDLLLTDLQMPRMNGLELVEHVRRRHPALPVILMTAHGSEQIAVQALQAGAASYVPKNALHADLVGTVEGVLAAANADRQQRRLLDCLTETESQFELENDPALLPHVLSHAEAGLRRMKICDDSEALRVTIALQEALVNAMEHGNLEASSSLRETDAEAYRQLLVERRRQNPYCDRRIHVVARESRYQAVYIVRDEGRGFDASTLPDPTDPANLERTCGRGLLLIRTFMDHVTHSDSGREITMVKRRHSADDSAGANGA